MIGFLTLELENPAYSKPGKYISAIGIFSIGCMGLELSGDDLLGSPSSCTYEDQGKLKNQFRIEGNESEDNRRIRKKASEIFDEYAQRSRNQYL